MSTTPVVVDDSAVEKTFEDSRPANWWHLPVTTTVLGLLALALFGLRGIPGVESVYVLARESDLNPFGIVPERVTLPSMGGAIGFALLALLASAGLWVLQHRSARPPARLRLALLIVFAVAWVLTFMTWVISQRTLDVTTLLQATIVLAVPLAFGALSGVLSERAGVINIAIEGQLLFGAFGATLIGSLAGNVWIGLLSAPFMAMVMGALLALFAVGYHVQQIIVGVVLNVLAIGVTSFFFGTVMRDNPGVFNSPMRLPTLRIPLLADIPVIGRMLFEQNILVYLMWIIVAGLTVALFRTRWGLRVRAVGEHPKAADTVGIAVNLTRWKIGRAHV